MIDLDADSLPGRVPVIARRHGVMTPRLERDKAYRYWAWDTERNYSQTSRDLHLDIGTVREWARLDDWAIRYQHDRADIVPANIRATVALSLGNDAPAAADYLGRVAAGELPGDRYRLQAALAILDRVGFAVIHLDPANQPPDPTAQAAAKAIAEGDPSGLTAALLDRLRSRLDPVEVPTLPTPLTPTN